MDARTAAAFWVFTFLRPFFAFMFGRDPGHSPRYTIVVNRGYAIIRSQLAEAKQTGIVLTLIKLA